MNQTDILKALPLLLLFTYTNSFSQSSDNIKIISAGRLGTTYDIKTKKYKDFALCGDNISTDSINFFSLLPGCERDNWLSLSRYTYRNDTFYLQPYNFIRENPYLEIHMVNSKNALQQIHFVSAENKSIVGTDSSWVVRYFKGRKQKISDCSTDSILTIKRGKYDGMELFQLSNIFGVPVVLWLNKQYDYDVTINMPQAALTRRILGATTGSGIGVIDGNSFILNNSKRKFKIYKTLNN